METESEWEGRGKGGVRERGGESREGEEKYKKERGDRYEVGEYSKLREGIDGI